MNTSEPQAAKRETFIKCNLRAEGTVQGVGFRAWTKQSADKLLLTGGVRNNPDGSVSAILYGSQESVDHFLVQARRGGPPRGRVDSLTFEQEVVNVRPEKFEIWR